MIKARKIWIAKHPTSGYEEISTSEPSEQGIYLCHDYGQQNVENDFCSWVEHICIPIEEE